MRTVIYIQAVHLDINGRFNNKIQVTATSVVWEEEIRKCEILCLEQDSNTNLLYSREAC